MAQVVAGRVGAVLGEFLTETEVGGTVKPGHEAVDDSLGDQVETVDRSERCGIKKSL